MMRVIKAHYEKYSDWHTKTISISTWYEHLIAIFNTPCVAVWTTAFKEFEQATDQR